MWSNAPAPRSPTSSFCVNRQLDARVRLAFGDDPPRRLDHRDDGRLVVSAENGACGVTDDPVRDDGLEGALWRHGVEVRAEEDRRSAVRPAGQPAQEVARVGVDAGAGIVLLDLEAQGAELGRDTIGDRALVSRWTGDRAQLREEVERRGHVVDPRSRGSAHKILRLAAYFFYNIVAVASAVTHELVQKSLVGEALEHGPVAVFVAGDDGRYLAVNAYACELLGYTQVRAPRTERGGRGRRSGGTDELHRDAAQGVAHGTTTLRDSDGSELEMCFRASHSTVGGMRVYIGICWPAE